MIETHAHLDSEKYDNHRERVIKDAFAGDIDLIVNICSDAESIGKVMALSKNYEKIYASIGIQPHSASEFNDKIEKTIYKYIEENKKIVAIGEIGLDYHYNFSPPHIQRTVFREQLKIAKNVKLPVVVHSREATDDTLRILDEEKMEEIGGVIHCFTGNTEEVKKFMKRGYYIGIGGAVTFKNTISLQEAVKIISIEQILLETDCPYMTPAPHRGKRNEPAYLKYVAEKIAFLKGISLNEIIKETTKNALTLFSIKDNTMSVQ